MELLSISVLKNFSFNLFFKKCLLKKLSGFCFYIFVYFSSDDSINKIKIKLTHPGEHLIFLAEQLFPNSCKTAAKTAQSENKTKIMI